MSADKSLWELKMLLSHSLLWSIVLFSVLGTKILNRSSSTSHVSIGNEDAGALFW